MHVPHSDLPLLLAFRLQKGAHNVTTVFKSIQTPLTLRTRRSLLSSQLPGQRLHEIQAGTTLALTLTDTHGQARRT